MTKIRFMDWLSTHVIRFLEEMLLGMEADESKMKFASRVKKQDIYNFIFGIEQELRKSVEVKESRSLTIKIPFSRYLFKKKSRYPKILFLITNKK